MDALNDIASYISGQPSLCELGETTVPWTVVCHYASFWRYFLSPCDLQFKVNKDKCLWCNFKDIHKFLSIKS